MPDFHELEKILDLAEFELNDCQMIIDESRHIYKDDAEFLVTLDIKQLELNLRRDQLNYARKAAEYVK